jgi:hypothetical protein
MSDYEYELGATEVGMVNIETLISAVPSGVTFTYTPVVRVAGNGLAIGDGYPTCEWSFEYLSWADFGTMLAFLGSSESASVYIKTRRPDNTYDTYTAVMHRPLVPQEAKQTIGGWTRITFRFTMLEVV